MGRTAKPAYGAGHQLAASPQEHIDLLELMFQILGLRFEGRFGTSANGRRQLETVRHRLSDTSANVLAQASRAAGQIVVWTVRHLERDAPSLQALIHLLKPFNEVETMPETRPAPPREKVRDPHIPGLATCKEALQTIRSACEWFESHEPSGPVAVLLKQSGRMVGQRFAQVADAIPLGLLHKWESAGETPR